MWVGFSHSQRMLCAAVVGLFLLEVHICLLAPHGSGGGSSGSSSACESCRPTVRCIARP